jgi:hypothetical protein
MNTTYSAILRNGQIEWGQQGPPTLAPNEAVPIEVRVLPKPMTDDERRVKLGAIYNEFMAKGGLSLSESEVEEWLADLRMDRPLVGRAE